MLIQWYHSNDRNSLCFYNKLTQSGSVLLETAVWGGDFETVLKQFESGANVNYQNKVNNMPSSNTNTQ